MIGELLLLSSLMVSAPQAATPAQKPRTLPELVALAMAEGKESPVGSALAESLNLGSNAIPKRKLRYDQDVCPDKREHTFGVLYRESDGKREPTEFMITMGRSKEVGGSTTVESMIYLADMAGDLKSAFRKHGPIENVSVEAVALGPAIRKRFRAELNFFLKVAPALRLQFEK